MPQTPTLDLNTAFKFYFQDPDWLKKTLIGGLIALTFIGVPAVAGWGLVIQRRTIRGEEPSLPEWDNLGDYFILGLKLLVSGIVWSAPVLLPFCALSLPLFLAPGAIETDPDFWEPILLAFTFGIQCIVWLGIAYFYIILPIYTGLLAESDTIAGSLNIRRGLRLFRANWQQFLGVALLGFAVYYAAYLAGFILLCIGIFFTYPVSWAILCQLFGQAYRIADFKLAGEQ